MDFHTLKRKELQALCKKNNVPANITNAAMADSLSFLPFVEGLEELVGHLEFKGSESTERSVITSPTLPRTTTRRQVTKEVVEEGSKNPIRTRCGTRRRGVEVTDTRNTPATRTQRNKVALESSVQKKTDKDMQAEFEADMESGASETTLFSGVGEEVSENVLTGSAEQEVQSKNEAPNAVLEVVNEGQETIKVDDVNKNLVAEADGDVDEEIEEPVEVKNASQKLDFHSLGRKDLQSLCKKNKVPANTSNSTMADVLESLEIVVGLEEFIKDYDPEAPLSPEMPEMKYSVQKEVQEASVQKKADKDMQAEFEADMGYEASETTVFSGVGEEVSEDVSTVSAEQEVQSKNEAPNAVLEVVNEGQETIKVDDVNRNQEAEADGDVDEDIEEPAGVMNTSQKLDFHSIGRKVLQSLCKKNKVPANTSNSTMANALESLEIVIGLEEFIKDYDPDAPLSPEMSEMKSCVRRSCTGRKATKEPMSSELMTKSSQGTRTRVMEEIEEARNIVSKTPAARSTRQKAVQIGSALCKKETVQKKETQTCTRRRAFRIFAQEMEKSTNAGADEGSLLVVEVEKEPRCQPEAVNLEKAAVLNCDPRSNIGHVVVGIDGLLETENSKQLQCSVVKNDSNAAVDVDAEGSEVTEQPRSMVNETEDNSGFTGQLEGLVEERDDSLDGSADIPVIVEDVNVEDSEVTAQPGDIMNENEKDSEFLEEVDERANNVDMSAHVPDVSEQPKDLVNQTEGVEEITSAELQEVPDIPKELGDLLEERDDNKDMNLTEKNVEITSAELQAVFEQTANTIDKNVVEGTDACSEVSEESEGSHEKDQSLEEFDTGLITKDGESLTWDENVDEDTDSCSEASEESEGSHEEDQSMEEFGSGSLIQDNETNTLVENVVSEYEISPVEEQVTTDSDAYAVENNLEREAEPAVANNVDMSAHVQGVPKQPKDLVNQTEGVEGITSAELQDVPDIPKELGDLVDERDDNVAMNQTDKIVEITSADLQEVFEQTVNAIDENVDEGTNACSKVSEESKGSHEEDQCVEEFGSVSITQDDESFTLDENVDEDTDSCSEVSGESEGSHEEEQSLEEFHSGSVTQAKEPNTLDVNVESEYEISPVEEQVTTNSDANVCPVKDEDEKQQKFVSELPAAEAEPLAVENNLERESENTQHQSSEAFPEKKLTVKFDESTILADQCAHKEKDTPLCNKSMRKLKKMLKEKLEATTSLAKGMEKLTLEESNITLTKAKEDEQKENVELEIRQYSPFWSLLASMNKSGTDDALVSTVISQDAGKELDDVIIGSELDNESSLFSVDKLLDHELTAEDSVSGQVAVEFSMTPSKSASKRWKPLLLNTPSKSSNRTPLHSDVNKENVDQSATKTEPGKINMTVAGSEKLLSAMSMGKLKKEFKNLQQSEKKRHALQARSENCCPLASP